MSKVNENFLKRLNERGVQMKIEEGEGMAIYRGKLGVNEHHIVDFAVSITNDDENATCQIVFNNVAYCKSFEEKAIWFEILNELNLTQGVYYYFAMDRDGRIFARYITQITSDIDQFIDVFLAGVSIVQQATRHFTDEFGAFVVVE